MFTNNKTVSFAGLLITLIFVLSVDAHASHSRRHCNDNLVVTEVTELNFGNYLGATGGMIIVTPGSSRSTTGPVLVGGTVSAGVFSVYNTLANCDVYPVRIRYRGNPRLSGPGANMPMNTFEPPNNTLFTISPLANVPTIVNIGANLDSPAGQTNGPYTGTYRVQFSHRRP